MKVGSLFSGIGGFDLGLERAGFEISWQVEIDEYARKVLRKHWPGVVCHSDIKSIDWKEIPAVDLVCGGFPCQPFSCAGKRAGSGDDRYLWPEVVRCLEVLKPAWFLGENVPGLINLGLDQVLTDLESLGYETQTLSIPACAVDAPHRRDRLWIVAHSNSGGFPGSGVCAEQSRGAETVSTGEARKGCHVANAARLQPGRKKSRTIGERTRECSESGDVGDTKTLRLEWRRNKSESDRQRGSALKPMGAGSTRNGSWFPEPAVGGTPDGLPSWLDRHIGKGMSYEESQRALKTLRKLWKPDVAQAIWREAGGLDRVSQAEVLFSIVREYKKDAHKARLLLASPEALKAFVRGVWRKTETASSSRRSRHGKQRTGEHPDAMQVVSRFPSCDAETPWPSIGWEDGIPRVASGIENRVDRLKGLGNAVVPQIVEALGRMIMESTRTGSASD